MRIAFVGALKPIHERYCTHWTGIDAAFTRLPHEHKIFCCRHDQDYIQKIIQYKPDVLIYSLIDMAIDVKARVRLRDALPSTKIVFWYGDCRTPEMGQVTVDISSTVDLFIASNDGLKEFQKQSFGMEPIFVPLAAEPIPFPIYSEKAAHEFIFIGGKFNRRGFLKRFDLIDELERYHGLRVINGGSPDERAKVYQLMPKFYGSAKFTLDVSHFWDIPKYTSNRYWVIPANWGFPLTKRFPGHEELVPETHHVYWDTIEELVDKMNFYRAHEDERQKMIRLGWEYAKDHHTYEHRIKTILGLLGLC